MHNGSFRVPEGATIGLTGRTAHQRAQDHDVREEGKKVKDDGQEWTGKHDNKEEGEYM
jgi:hypothetical protein